MGRIIDENSYVNQVANDFRNKLDSPFVRLIDKNPTPTVYYNIDHIRSTVDDGIYTTERQTGSHSPLRYNRIEGLPIYIDSNVLLELQESDEGLTTRFEADGILLPGTIEPYPDDFFYIEYLGKNFLFRVTKMEFDTIKSYNYYKISFVIKSVDSSDTIDDLERQTVQRYNCILRNIGTDERWLLQEDDYAAVLALNSIIRNMSEMYLEFFYDARYNSILYRDEYGRSIYDRYLTYFINRNKVFMRKFDYETTVLTEVDIDPTFRSEYMTSLYRLLEMKKPKLVKDVPFTLIPIRDPLSIFKIYNDDSVYSVKFMNMNVGQWYFPGGILYEPKFKPKLIPMDIPIRPEDKKEEPYPIQEKNPSGHTSHQINNMGTSWIDEPKRDNGLGDVDNTVPNEEYPWDVNEVIATEEDVNILPTSASPEEESTISVEEGIVQPPTTSEDIPDVEEELIVPRVPEKELVEPEYPAQPIPSVPDIDDESRISDHSSPEDVFVPDPPKTLMEKDDRYIDLSPDDIEGDLPIIEESGLPIYKEVLKGYLNGSIDRLSKLPIKKLNELVYFPVEWDTFITIPLTLYALTELYERYMTSNIDK